MIIYELRQFVSNAMWCEDEYLNNYGLFKKPSLSKFFL
jgi:hypothetical protein